MIIDGEQVAAVFDQYETDRVLRRDTEMLRAAMDAALDEEERDLRPTTQPALQALDSGIEVDWDAKIASWLERAEAARLRTLQRERAACVAMGMRFAAPEDMVAL